MIKIQIFSKIEKIIASYGFIIFSTPNNSKNMGTCISLFEDRRTQTQNIYHEKELEQNSFDDLKVFSFDGIITKCKIVDVYDGDTITIVLFLNDRPIKLKFRMLGYDSPEIKPSKTLANRELHKDAAVFVRDKLKERILNKVLWVSFVEEEKYGRAMGKLYEVSNTSPNAFSGNEICINTWMIDNKYGKVYNGGRKEEFTTKDLSDAMH